MKGKDEGERERERVEEESVGEEKETSEIEKR